MTSTPNPFAYHGTSLSKTHPFVDILSPMGSQTVVDANNPLTFSQVRQTLVEATDTTWKPTPAKTPQQPSNVTTTSAAAATPTTPNLSRKERRELKKAAEKEKKRKEKEEKAKIEEEKKRAKAAKEFEALQAKQQQAGGTAAEDGQSGGRKLRDRASLKKPAKYNAWYKFR